MEHFQEAAKNWDTNEKIEMNRSFAKAIAQHLKSDERALRFLDFGCGTGLLSQFFAKNASELIGIDTTREMLDEFEKKFSSLSHVSTRKLNLENEEAPHDLGSFDVIMTAMAFHHLDHPIEVLKILKSLLKPHGQIFVIDLDKEDGSFHPNNEEMGVKHFGFAEEKLRSWATELGFENFEHEIVHKMEKNEREYPVFMGSFLT